MYSNFISAEKTEFLIAQKSDNEDYPPSDSYSIGIEHNLPETTSRGVDMEPSSDEEGEVAIDTEETTHNKFG